MTPAARAKIKWGSALLIIVLQAGIPSGQAFVSYRTDSGQPQKWNLVSPSNLVNTNVVNRATRAVRYFLSADAYSRANAEAELNAARACFDQWQAIPGSILRFEEGGLLSGNLDVNTTDNTNLIYWAKSTTLVNAGLDNIYGATGVTFADFFSDGTLAEVDIVLNGQQFTWFTDFSNNINQGQFVESVLLHEVGHFIGLAHSPLGASTMFPRGSGGVSLQAGLSPDEIAAVHALYPQAGTPGTIGRITGAITISGNPALPVLGGVAVAEDGSGNIIAATLSGPDGRYTLAGIPPGPYRVHVTPVDPGGASYFLFRGSDAAGAYAAAATQFLPSEPVSVNVLAGAEAAAHFAVAPGTPKFRVGRIWPPTTEPAIKVVVNYPVSVLPGQQGLVAGVYSSEMPGPNAKLRITGNGFTFGETTVQADAFPGVNPPLNLLSVSFSVAQEASPGLRSFVVEQGTGVTYASGFLEVLPPFPDFNFDGLNDSFQRHYFPRWTGPQAAPATNPDGDNFTNAEEYLAGTNPMDSASVLQVESVRWDSKGATVSWKSAPGRRYQVLSRPRVNSIRGWQKMGEPIPSSGATTEFLDTSAGALEQQFYRVQALP